MVTRPDGTSAPVTCTQPDLPVQPHLTEVFVAIVLITPAGVEFTVAGLRQFG